MERSLTKRFLLNTFWLSVLLHLLILLVFTTIIMFRPEEKQQSPNVYVPSYVYQNKVTPTIQQHRSVRSQKRESNERSQLAEKETVSQTQKKVLPTAKKGVPQKTILTATLDMLNANQLKSISASFHNTEPIYLVGEQNAVSDPFIILIGKALSAHFEYPRTAGELGIKGRVLISLTLHPEGYFSDVQIIKSSNDHDLDAAALYAVNQAPIIEGMDKFISEPKHFVVGFLFR